MKPFLTAEESQWLIAQFSKTDWRDYEDPNDWADQIVRQCTEKPFPDVKIKSGWEDEVVSVSIGTLHNGKDYIEVQSTGASSSFTSPQFKEFTKACNKIVEWIEEQE